MFHKYIITDWFTDPTMVSNNDDFFEYNKKVGSHSVKNTQLLWKTSFSLRKIVYQINRLKTM